MIKVHAADMSQTPVSSTFRNFDLTALGPGHETGDSLFQNSRTSRPRGLTGISGLVPIIPAYAGIKTETLDMLDWQSWTASSSMPLVQAICQKLRKH